MAADSVEKRVLDAIRRVLARMKAETAWRTRTASSPENTAWHLISHWLRPGDGVMSADPHGTVQHSLPA